MKKSEQFPGEVTTSRPADGRDVFSAAPSSLYLLMKEASRLSSTSLFTIALRRESKPNSHTQKFKKSTFYGDLSVSLWGKSTVPTHTVVVVVVVVRYFYFISSEFRNPYYYNTFFSRVREVGKEGRIQWVPFDPELVPDPAKILFSQTRIVSPG